MIKEKELDVLITRRNISFYKSLGYNVDKIDTKVSVKIEDINKNSHQKITAVCEICGAEIEIRVHKYYENVARCGYYGCKKCSREKAKKTCLERYGDEYYNNKEQIEKTCLERYNVKTTLLEEKTKEKIKLTNLKLYGTEEVLSSLIIREKSKITLMKKYGVDHFSKTKEFLNKFEKTSLLNYGVTHPCKSEIIKNKIQKTNLKIYGHITPLLSKIVQHKLNEKYKDKYPDVNILEITKNMVTIKCECGEICEITKNLLYFRHKINTKICTKCNTIGNNRSGKEILLYEFILQHYNDEIIINDRKILNGLELDIYIPKLKLGIEFNGMYWHSELYKDKNYHYDKMKKCIENGIFLINVWESDWDTKKEIIKSIILKRLKSESIIIKKDNFNFKYLKRKDITNFINDNYMYANIKSNIKIGIYQNEELLSVLFINKKDKDYDLIGICDNKNYIVEKSLEFIIDKLDFKDLYLKIDSSYYYDNYDNFSVVKLELPKQIYIKDTFRVFNSGKLIYKYKKI